MIATAPARRRAISPKSQQVSPPRIDFIASTEFDTLDERQLLREHDQIVRSSNPIDEKGRKNLRALPPHLARLCEARLFTPEEERATFRRMNLAKHLARDLADTPRWRTSPAIQKRVERLLEVADAERNRIIQANLRLVVSIAKKFRCVGATFDDLLSEGSATLIRAVEKFDYQRGFRFSTYATQAVRRCFCRLISDTNVDRSRFVAAEPDWFERSASDDAVGTMTEGRWRQLKAALGNLLGKLDAREQQVVRRRFGLDASREPITLQSLADEMGVCKERVRQIEQRAIAKLRSMAERVELEPLQESA